MKKKKTIITVLIVVILFIIMAFGTYLILDSQKIKTYSTLRIEDDKYNEIINKKTQVGQNIEDLAFNGYPLLYDASSNMYYYSVLQEDGIGIDPTITYKTKFGTKVAFKDIDINDELIHDNRHLEMLVYNSKEYYKAEIVCTSLPIINIISDTIPETKTDQVMTMTVFDNGNGVKERLQTSDGYIRIKGASTTNYPKRSFRINLREFDEEGNVVANSDRSFLGLRNDDDYMLYAGYNDQEKIRNVFSSNLWYESCADDNLAGVKNGMYYEYAELFFNNEYYGLYALGFPIDKKQLKLSGGENLYKKMEWGSEFEMNVDEDGPFADYELKTEGDNDTQAWRDLRDYYYTLINTDDNQTLYDMVDINNSIDIYLFFSLIIGDDNIDGYDLKNLYMFTKYIDGKMKMFYTPWDMDFSWGNQYYKPEQNWTDTYGYAPDNLYRVMLQNPVQYLLNYEDENIKSLIKERYNNLRENGWSNENVMKLIDYLGEDIYNSGAYLRDKNRWPDGTYLDDGVELTRFKEFVAARFKFFDSYVVSLTAE